MKTSFRSAAVTVSLAVLLAGCSTGPTVSTASRINEKADVFAKLTPEVQKTVQSGTIERGFTTDMVYMALGHPAKVRAKDAPLGKLEMWTYVRFTQQTATAQNNLNHPDSPGYVPMLTAVNAPVHVGQPDATLPVGFGFGAGPGSSMGPLNVPDMKAEKLYVFFANGRVAEIKYDSSGT